MSTFILIFREYTRRYKKLYLIPVGGIVLSSILIYIVTISNKANISADISLSIFGSIFASFLIHFTIEMNKILNDTTGVRTIDPIYRGDFFNKSVQQSENLKWHFKGGTGSWIRSYVLTEFKKISVKKDQQFEILAQIINPFEPKLCESYAEYKQSFQGVGLGKLYDRSSVQRDLLATVVIIIIEELLNSNFKAEIYYQDYFSDFRIDLSHNFAIMSRDDNKEILAIPRENPLYKGFKNDFERSKLIAIKQDKILVHTNPTQIIDDVFVTIILKELYKSNKQAFNLTTSEVAIITEKVISKENRYSQ